MATLYRGTTAVSKVMRGSTPVSAIYRGSTLMWTPAPIFDNFLTPGWLNDWVTDSFTEDALALISDEVGALRDGLGNLVGNTVAFVQNTETQIGQLVTHAGTALVDAYCAAWGGTAPEGGGTAAPPPGLVGFINGIPLIGQYISTALADIVGTINDPATITQLVGKIPVIGQLATAIGLLPDEVSGALAPPINYVIDQLGNVIGTITCGAYTLSGDDVASEIQYVIGVAQQQARMLIPDGLLSLDTRTSRYRWPTPLSGDDGYVEVRLADAGTGRGMKTQVFRRYSNDGSANDGVGMQFVDGSASIVHRTGGADTIVAPGLSGYHGGDIFRLDTTGTSVTLSRNGTALGGGPTTISSTTGSTKRSVGMLMQGGKELLGPRKYSPGLDYLLAA